ncbi:GIP [Symbiodinium sp. KB8]|nr:GIP [Symbiodinium sp. KB8]
MIARPSTLPRLLDFNSCVGIDLFYVHDINDKRHTFLSMVDWATTYHVVTKLDSETSEDVERAFNSSWINPFGAPYMVSLDLDPKIQSGMSRLCDWHNIKVKDAAAQAHWQAGVTERQGGWFKGIWDRVVQDLSLEDAEVEIAGTLVCAAKNELRRRCGHSPTQWVFGKLPRLPPELGDPDAGEEVSWDVTKEMNVYGEHYYRGPGPNRGTSKQETPCIIGSNLKTVAEEDGSGQQWWWVDKEPTIGSRELGSAGSQQLNISERLALKKLARADEDQGDHDMVANEPPGHLPLRRLKKKTRPGPYDDKPDEVMMIKRDLTQRGHAKRQEKELMWKEIPEEARPLFKEAEKKQWLEHLEYDALQALSVEESRLIRATVANDRILRSRWAYKDKNWAARQSGKQPEWRCKSRLIIGGHLDPDLGSSEITTDAPTLSRAGLTCLLQLLANGLAEEDPWEVAAGDIQCAFLTGSYLNRDEPLYLQQPGTGFPGLLPEQPVIIKKNIFGLATSPHEWWEDLQKGIYKTTIVFGETTFGWEQCPLDPCIFMLKEKRASSYVGRPIGYIGTHVDDILVIAPKTVGERIKEGLSKTFPIDKWEVNHLDYIGSEIEVTEDQVKVSQKKYVETRLFSLDVPKGVCEEDFADTEIAADNKSLIGALSWLSAQTRPDLTCSVSLAQQLQKAPTYGDIKFTNVVASRARAYKDNGLTFKAIPLSEAVFLIYHDAAWANAIEANEPGFELYEEDLEAGLQKEGPYSTKERKARRINSKVASQVGALVVLANIECVYEGRGNISVLDWKSRAGQRVCRSTFGAETQASVEGLEAGQYMRSFLETVAKGELVTVEAAVTPAICLSDCRSLYDHIHKEGVPRVPSDRRLAIDLAALRQGLRWEKWYSKLPLAWVPSGLQLGDVLTKPVDPGKWWEMLSSKLSLPIEVGCLSVRSSVVSLQPAYFLVQMLLHLIRGASPVRLTNTSVEQGVVQPVELTNSGGLVGHTTGGDSATPELNVPALHAAGRHQSWVRFGALGV